MNHTKHIILVGIAWAKQNCSELTLQMVTFYDDLDLVSRNKFKEHDFICRNNIRLQTSIKTNGKTFNSDFVEFQKVM